MNCPHCETEVDEHEANRCLDAWVAEAVMGHRELDYEDFGVPNFSTQIAAAWEVVGRMENTQINGHAGPTFLHRLRRCSPGRKWGVVWCTDFGYTNEVMGPTAQLAICRAALKAVREPA